MISIEAVTLDAAGTLIHPREAVGETYRRIAADFGARLDADALGAGFRRVFPAMPPMAFAAYEPADLDRRERAWWAHLVRDVTDAAGGVTRFDDYFDALYAYFAAPEAWQLFPDVAPLLSALRDRAVPVAVVSNFDSRLVPVLAGLGLDLDADAIVYSTAAGAAKPDPRIFGIALEHLGVAPGACLHVGDNPGADAAGAAAAGLQARVIVRDRQPAGGHEIARLTAVLELL